MITAWEDKLRVAAYVRFAFEGRPVDFYNLRREYEGTGIAVGRPVVDEGAGNYLIPASGFETLYDLSLGHELKIIPLGFVDVNGDEISDHPGIDWKMLLIRAGLGWLILQLLD